MQFEAHIASIFESWLRFPVGSGYAYSNLGIDLAIAALTGLLSIGLIQAIPLVIYAGFLGHLDLLLWQKAALHIPLAHTAAAAGAAAMAIPAWLQRWWTLRDRVLYSIFVLAAAVLVFLLGRCQMIGP